MGGNGDIPILGRTPGSVTAVLPDRLRVEAEFNLGMRCAGCMERIELGFKMTRISGVFAAGGIAAKQEFTYACDPDHHGDRECTYYRRMLPKTTVVERVAYGWVQDVEIDVSTMRAIQNYGPAPDAEPPGNV